MVKVAAVAAPRRYPFTRHFLDGVPPPRGQPFIGLSCANVGKLLAQQQQQQLRQVTPSQAVNMQQQQQQQPQAPPENNISELFSIAHT